MHTKKVIEYVREIDCKYDYIENLIRHTTAKLTFQNKFPTDTYRIHGWKALKKGLEKKKKPIIRR